MMTQLTKAIEIVDKLQEWLDGILEGHEVDCDLYAGLSYSANDVLAVTVGDICVFCNQANSPDDLTFEACRDKFLESIEQYVPFLAVERQGS